MHLYVRICVCIHVSSVYIHASGGVIACMSFDRSFEEYRREEKAALMKTLKLEASGVCI